MLLSVSVIVKRENIPDAEEGIRNGLWLAQKRLTQNKLWRKYCERYLNRNLCRSQGRGVIPHFPFNIYFRARILGWRLPSKTPSRRVV